MNGRILEKKGTGHKYVFVDFLLQLLSETFLILRRIQRDVITNVCWSSCTVPVRGELSYLAPLGSGQSFWLQIQRSRVRFPALPDFLSSSGSGTGSTQPREVN